MDRNSYSHGQLQELFFPVAVMLVKYDKIDKEALSPALIHGTMFLDSSSKNYVDYFDFHLLESAFNSDKYIRNCIIQLIGTGGEFEEKKFNGSHQRSYYYKNMINGVEKQKILADLLDFDLKSATSSNLSQLIGLVSHKLVSIWKDSYNIQYEKYLAKSQKQIASMLPPASSTRNSSSGSKSSSNISSLSKTNSSSETKKITKSELKSFLSAMNDKDMSNIVLSELICRDIKNIGTLYSLSGLPITREIRNQSTIEELESVIIEKDNRIKSLLAVIRLNKQNLRRAETKLNENNIYLENLVEDILLDDVNNNNNNNIPPPVAVQPEMPQVSISQRFLDLIIEANVFTMISHYKDILTIRSGVIIQDLRSTCGCSMEKIPHIILLVIVLFIGILDNNVMDKLIKATTTYNLATERSNHQLRLQTKKLFNDIHYSKSSIIGCCLSADASNKKDNNWIVKPCISLCTDLAVRARSFDTDFSISKKSVIGSESQFESIIAEVGMRGVVRIRSACADGFGVPEMQLVMKLIDFSAKAQWECNNNRDQMSTMSPLLYSKYNIVQEYIYGPFPIREERVRNCAMHGLQICFESITEFLMGDSGLNYNATVSQNLYKLSYFQAQFKHQWNALNIIAGGGQVDGLSNLSKHILNKFKKFCSTRWLSVERQSDALVDALNIESTHELNLMCCETIVGGIQSEEWKSIAKKCCCIDDENKISHMIIMFLILANHTPGGKAGLGLINCSQIVAFLSSPLQRISIKICAALYPKHLEGARFIDSASNIHQNTFCINTKLIEAIVFERDFVEWSHSMMVDWKVQLPSIPIFISLELNRCENIDMMNFNRVDVMNKIDDLMTKGCTKLFSMSEKYFQLPLMQRGFNILHSVDPFLSKHWAVAVLNGLVDSQIIYLSNAKIAELDDITNTIAEEELEEVAIIPPHIWTISDKFYAFPKLSFKDYREQIYNSYYVNCDDESYEVWSPEYHKVLGVVSAYGMDHPAFVNELFMLASGHLSKTLKLTDYWQVGTPVEGYYNDIFEEEFPLISDSLFFNFSYCLYAQTIAEQQFTVFSNSGHANSSESTMRKDLSHCFNVRSSIIREMKHNNTQLIPGESLANIPLNIIDSTQTVPKRAIRNKIDRQFYVQNLVDLGDSLFNPLEDEVVSIPTLLGRGKRKNDMIRVLSQTRQELLACRKSSLIATGNTKITTLMDQFYNSALNNLNELPPEILNIYETALSDKKAWSTKFIKAYIINEVPLINRSELNKMKKDIGVNDPADYRSLIVYITELWQTSNISGEQLQMLSQHMKNGEGDRLVLLYNIK